MKASVRRNYGSPSKLHIVQIEKPTPKDHEVLIQVHATTVNRTDCANLTAQPFIMRFVLGLFKPKKIITGTDFAGEVISIGSKVRTRKIGDRVFGFNDAGFESQAEYLCTSAENVFPIPENLYYKEAAASLEGAHYAYSFIQKVNLKPGQSILINGSSGGIGSALLQFVRQYEVKITATCNTKNIERIQSLGADRMIDYTKEDFTQKREWKYDVIFDAVGKSTFGQCKSLLKKKGVYISSELGPYVQNVFYPLFTVLTNKKVFFPIPHNTKETIPYISHLLKKGKFKPIIDREYTLEEIAEAYTYVLKGEKTGNVLIKIMNNNS